MDWSETEKRQALTPIVEMLVALAFLADRACGRSLPLRRLILSILAPAEAFARNFVLVEARAACGAIPALPVPTPTGDSVADAMRLAACFRALAMVLGQIAIQPIRLARWLIDRQMPLRYWARIRLDLSSGTAFKAASFDTS